jgi:hypothetical protein
MKRIKITAANAVKKGLVKVGDEVWVKCKISEIDSRRTDYPISIGYGFDLLWISYGSEILIPKPEPKPIDFGKAGLILKGEISIVKTTGYCGTECFSGIYLNGNCTKGFTSNGFIKDQNMWQDITETYYLNNPK